jgi:hypothetical protein
MQSSSCEVHIKMLLSYFRNSSLEGQNVKSFECELNLDWGLAKILMATPQWLIGRNQHLGLLPNAAVAAHQSGQKIDSQWIKSGLLRRWKRVCDTTHGNKCQAAVKGRLVGQPPKFLVDTWLLCLVPGVSGIPYIALSYVWGTDAFFKTSSTDLAFLQTKNAFLDPQRRHAIPQTILDGISITQVLGERYLWVDALCIVQDDDEMKQQEIVSPLWPYAKDYSISGKIYQRKTRGLELPSLASPTA